MPDLADVIPDGEAWAWALAVRGPSDLETLVYGQFVIGPRPTTWTGQSWHYESARFLSAKVPISALLGALSTDSGGRLQIGHTDIVLPSVQSTAQVLRRPSFELHDLDRSAYPSIEYQISEANQTTGLANAARMNFLVGTDGPTFIDLDAAYRAFFRGEYDALARDPLPSQLLQIRVLDETAVLGPIHIRATEMSVEVRGTNPVGATLEYFSPQRRERYPITEPGTVSIALPDGLPASNAWLWLTRGTMWHDYRALTGPGASTEQLEAAGVDREGDSRDEQATAEAIVYGGEGPGVEFKSEIPKSATATDRIFRTVAAFANGAGGTIVIGVDRDETTVVGIGDESDARSARDRIGQMIRVRVIPTPNFEIKTGQVAGKNLLFIRVDPGANRIYGVVTDLGHRDEPRYFVRRGASTYPAQPSDLNDVIQRAAASTASWRGPWPQV